MPAFMGVGLPLTPFGHLNYLWGNIPAFDVLNIEKNEGCGYTKDIDMCFAGEYNMPRDDRNIQWPGTALSVAKETTNSNSDRIMIKFFHHYPTVDEPSSALIFYPDRFQV